MRSLGLLLLLLGAASATPIISGLLSGVVKGYSGRRSSYAAAKTRCNGATSVLSTGGKILGGILGAQSGGSYAANGYESQASKYQAAQSYASASKQAASESYASNIGSEVLNQNAASAQNYASNSALANTQVVTNSRSEQKSESRKEETKETKEESSVAMSIGEAQLNQQAASQLGSAGSASTASSAADSSQKATKSQKRSGRKAKVKSTQSIRILMPGRNQAGKAAAAAGNYAKTSKTIGQSMSKHKSEENSSSVMSQVGSRTDTASVIDKRHVGVDASQQAHFNTDSTGMQEIVLTQSSVAQKKKSRIETRTSSESANSDGALAYATSAKKSSSSKVASSRASEVIEESSRVQQVQGGAAASWA